MDPILSMSKVRVFFDGTFTEPRLNHPEGIAPDRDGNIWCGGEEGEIYRIAADASGIELYGKTGGFSLGVAIDSRGRVYVCDMKYAAVFRLQPDTRALQRFADGTATRKMSCPNYAVVDEPRGYLYVSDSQECGPGIWRCHLESGEAEMWYDGDCVFANGMALSPDGNELYVVESFAEKVSRIAIAADGSAAAKTDVFRVPGTVPDGLAFDRRGTLYVSCYAPAQIYRYHVSEGVLELLVHDTRSLTLIQPTNIAFRGEKELFCANLGGSIVTRIEIDGDDQHT